MIGPVGTATPLEALYEEHAPALHRLGVALVGAAGAEDLVHDAFLRLHRVGRPPAPGTEWAYLRRTLVNLAHDHHRHGAVVRRAGRAAPGTAASAEATAAASAQDRAVAAAIGALPARQRECVVLHYFAGLSDAEIASDLGISAGSVKTHLHRARAALAHRLEHLR